MWPRYAGTNRNDDFYQQRLATELPRKILARRECVRVCVDAAGHNVYQSGAYAIKGCAFLHASTVTPIRFSKYVTES